MGLMALGLKAFEGQGLRYIGRLDLGGGFLD